MANHHELANFIWQIADLLRGPYRPPQYERVMLPFVVLRRFDCVLAATKAKVVAEFEKLKGGKVTGDALDPRLNKIAGTDFRFHNHSPLDLEKLKGDPDHIDKHLVSYLNGFSANVRRIFEYFEIGAEIEKMHEANILFLVVSKFCDVDLHPDKVPNEEMGKLFEHLIRKFNEQANETAGDHFTPREVIDLMVDLLFIDDDAVLSKPNIVRKLLDPACGTGGMLTQALNYIDEHDQAAELWVFGQDYNKRSYAVAASDLLLKGRDNSEIAFGDSLVDDQFGPGHSATQGRFDYLLANPPFGVDWKKQQKEIEKEHAQQGFAGRFGAGLPRVNDGALLFLQHMISKFEPVDKGGARLAIVLNGSPLFTGGAGSGESDIRKWIIENDWLEAVVALPEQMFFNTGIGTYIWIVTNRKEKRRKGKIQLVDTREFYIPMRRSLGDKRRKIGEGPEANEPSQIAEIVKTYGTAKEIDAAFVRDSHGNGLKWIALTNGGSTPTPEDGQNVKVQCISKVFDNDDFGYRRVTVERPLRLRFQITTERKSRFLDALPYLQDDVQAIDSTIGRQPFLDWDRVLEKIQMAISDRNDGRLWKKSEFKLFRDVFCEVDPTALPVFAAGRKAQKRPEDQIYGWFPGRVDKQDVRYEPDTKLRDFENIPLKQDEAEYFKCEVLPHVPDAWIDAEKTKFGYEISFNRHFSDSVQHRSNREFADWKPSRLKYIARFQAGENITGDSIYPVGEYPVYGGNGVRGFTDAFTHDGHFVLIGRQGALCGNVNYANGKFWASEHAVVVAPAQGIDVRWLGELLRSMDLRQYSMTAAQPGLSVEFVANLPVLVPPFEYQKRVSDFLDRETAKIDASIAEQESSLIRLKESRLALIAAAVTGQLSVEG